MTRDDRNPTEPESTAGAEPSGAEPPRGVSRRRALGYLAALPLAGAIELAPTSIERALRAADDARAARESGAAPKAPKFFTAHEWRTVRMLVDYVIPRDERSGSATEAGVPEFMDFIMGDKPGNQIWMRGGLAWLDLECEKRYGARFVTAKPAQRTAMLDDISWPDKAPADLHAGVAFFNRFRDMTASGFYTTRMGIDDVKYMGNVVRASWDGCPDAAVEHLGVKYSDVYKT
ncbi:MAG: gluconate 2-dehydrogenase subunit 3 family protein [Gemmatimonadota bacterium]|nr:gluconate 2-dehydrogenase subunit 3 family protein [Gemmatimonadota bacterium]